MWLSEISIKRPVLASVMSIVLLLLGAISFFKLPVREYPDIDPPIVSVTTVYRGAAPETIETSVTEILEDELVSIEGIKTISSSSKEQASNIVIEFELSRNVDVAAQDVRDRVSRVRQRLPEEVEEPIIAKQDADAQAILWLSLSGKAFTRLQLSDYADKYLVDSLQTVPGVGRVMIGGQREYAMRVWLDPMKMAARGITPGDIETALRSKNVEIPSGRIESQAVEFSVKTRGELSSPEMFNRLVIQTHEGVPVYLRDVGRAEIGAEDERSMVRFNGQPAVGLGIVKQSKANTLEVAHGIKAKLAALRKPLPPGMSLEIGYDSSVFIERSIEEVQQSLLIAGVLVVAVIFLFLRDARSALIPAISIPVSIVGTFTVMQAMGFTINTLTLLALTLSIGLVVDDTIVVLENISRHLEMGKSPFRAALDGTREIGFAVIATTLTLVTVFVPVGFMTGAVGKLLYEFAISVATSVFISGFVSLTLSPMLCSKLLKTASHDASGAPKGFLNRLLQRYPATLAWALAHPKSIISVSLLSILLSLALVRFMPSDFLPLEDRGSILTLIKAPEGATLAYTDRAVRQAEAIYRDIPEVARYVSVIALGSSAGTGRVNEGLLFTTLKPWEERKVKQQQVVMQIQPKMMQIPEAFVFPINPPSGPQRGFGGSIQLVLQGFDTQELYRYSQEILAKARSIPGIINLDTDLKMNKPQIDIQILRDRADALGVSPQEISRALQILLGGLNITDFNLHNKRYNVMLQADPQYRNVPEAIKTIMLRGREGQMIPLASVVRIQETVSPNELNHYNRLRSVTISGTNIPFLLSLGDALNKVQAIADDVLPASIQTTYGGESREFRDAGNAFYWAFGFALVIVYLVLAAQFESFKHPFTILLTVPLAVSGAVLTLFFLNASINVFSQIGIVLLIGLVTKNGILIVEYANQLRQEQGLSGAEAVLEATCIRLRPILMTTIATIFGALPIALAFGAGTESRQTMGIAIIGGMVFSTLLTLFLVPVVYALFNRGTLPLSTLSELSTREAL